MGNSKMGNSKLDIIIGLNAAIFSVTDEEPHILITRDTQDQKTVSSRDRLPFGPFDPLKHRTMDMGLRAWVAEQTGLNLAYVEQLYTFADRGRHAKTTSTEHEISVGYLALHNPREKTSDENKITNGVWQKIYRYLPWEDLRNGKPALIDDVIQPLLLLWIKASPTPAIKREREERAALCFGLGDMPWDEEKVIERYELLYEVGLVEETISDGRLVKNKAPEKKLGRAMHQDHRRILATALSRLRGKLKYRPVVFELMPASFTLFELQRCVEAITGHRLHKQNFRRQVEKTRLVTETGHMTSGNEGRPAKMYKFRQNVLKERIAPGLRVSPPGKQSS